MHKDIADAARRVRLSSTSCARSLPHLKCVAAMDIVGVGTMAMGMTCGSSVPCLMVPGLSIERVATWRRGD